MAKELDIFNQINNAILDLQGSQLQTFERPLKTLGRLLHHPDLEAINKSLIDKADWDAFIAESETTGGSMVGSHTLVWPDDPEQTLGLTLMLIEKFAEKPDYAIDFAHHYFYAGNKIVAGIHAITRQLFIPFARDYKIYVQNHGAAPKLMIGDSNKVFIVHGHDELALQALARFLEKLGLEAIVLKEQPNQGRTIIEKYEACAGDVGFAVVLLTPDDLGAAVSAAQQSARARQNVIFELGYFSGKLGRGKVCLLRKGDVEIPSDLFGIVYTEMDDAGGWKHSLVAELKAADLNFDANKLWA